MIPQAGGCACSCSAGKGRRLIFSRSGAADVGELADRAGRALHRTGLGRMFCLAGIGGRVSSILKTTDSALSILAIDGCPLDCARKSLEEAGVKKVHHLRLSDLGFEKGKTAVDEAAIDVVTKKAEHYL